MGTRIRMQALLCLGLLITAAVHAGDTTGIKKQVKSISFSSQYGLLNEALQNYYSIQEKGGWAKINGTQKYYMKGQAAPAIKQIKQRLRTSGEFTSDDTTSVFTDELVIAVQKIQRLYGMKDNGVVDARLIRELNIPVEDRIRQLQINMGRISSLPAASEGTRLIANIPEYKLHVYEGENHVFDMDIIVGAEGHETKTFNDEMTQIVFSPYWNIPPSIVSNEILPAIRRNKNYLRNNGYEITGYENGLPVIRQKPGPGNSLGLVKFVFPNANNIYFHDTPSKGLFQYQKRNFSHGCIRLAEPARLAEYLLRDSKEWTPAKIREAMESGSEQYVKLSSPAIVAITYFTAWVDNEGQLNFREDVYGLDKKEALTGVAMK